MHRDEYKRRYIYEGLSLSLILCLCYNIFREANIAISSVRIRIDRARKEIRPSVSKCDLRV